jgi:hypothetical protein
MFSKGEIKMKAIESYKGREIKEGENVKVYFDLHRHCFSIQKGNLVHGKANELVLKEVTFKVNEKRRQKVVEEGRKNVHAKVHGKITSEPIVGNLREAAYNPYFFKSFVDKETKKPIKSAKMVLLKDKKIFYSA